VPSIRYTVRLFSIAEQDLVELVSYLQRRTHGPLLKFLTISKPVCTHSLPTRSPVACPTIQSSWHSDIAPSSSTTI
jgi:hypothetical protein